MEKKCIAVELKQMSLLDYLGLSAPGWRSALSDHYLFHLADRQAVMTVEGGKTRAYAVVSRHQDHLMLLFLCTDPEHRRQGLAKEMLRMLLERTGVPLVCPLTVRSSCFEEMDGLLTGMGAERALSSRVYHVDTDQRLWERYDAPEIKRLRDFVLGGTSGLTCIPFSQGDPDLKEQLFQSPFTEFENRLDPRPFRNDPCADWDLSMAAVREGRLCAYTLLAKAGNDTVCFDHISASKAMIGKGVIFAPWYASMAAIREQPQIKRFNLMIHDTNDRSLTFTKLLLQGVDIQAVDNYRYQLTPKRIETQLS